MLASSNIGETGRLQPYVCQYDRALPEPLDKKDHGNTTTKRSQEFDILVILLLILEPISIQIVKV